jgi:single-strand DNA-binding protein
MNQFITLARVVTSPAIKTANDSKVATFTVEIAAYKADDPSWTLQVAAWGQLADDAAANIQQGAYLTIAGRLRLEKERPPELQLSEFHIVAAPPAPDAVISLELPGVNSVTLDAVITLELPGVNSISLVGRAGRDPEARYFESGSCVANLSLAVNRIGRDTPPDWFNLAIWGKQAQVAADYVRKGSLLGITGSLAEERWTDRDSGEERSKLVVRVNRLDLLGGRRDSEAAPVSDEEAPF